MNDAVTSIIAIGNLALLIFNAVNTTTNRRLKDKLEDMEEEIAELREANGDLLRKSAVLQQQVQALTTERIQLYQRLVQGGIK